MRDGTWPCASEIAESVTFQVPDKKVVERSYLVERRFDDTFTVQNIASKFAALRQAAQNAGASVSVTLKVEVSDPKQADPEKLAQIKAKLEEIQEGVSGGATFEY